MKPVATAGYEVNPPLTPYLSAYYAQQKKRLPDTLYGWQIGLIDRNCPLQILLIHMSNQEWETFTKWVRDTQGEQIAKALQLRLYTNKVVHGDPLRYVTKDKSYLAVFISPLLEKEYLEKRYLPLWQIDELDVLKPKEAEQVQSRFPPLAPLPPKPTSLQN